MTILTKKIRFVFCGCGGIANAWLHVFQQFQDDIEIVAVSDPIPTAFNKLKTFGFDSVPTFSDLDLIFAEGIEADAVLILTPPQYHARYIREAVYNECHVLTEKPFFCDMNDYRMITKEVIPYAEENNLITVVNQQYRWMPRINDIRQAIIDNKIGQIGFVDSRFCQNRYHFNAWWRQASRDISMLNWWIHHVDTMRYILGKNPVTVQAKLFHVPWSKIYGESSIFLNVTFQDNIEWHYTGTQESIGAHEDSGQSSFTIYGSKGCIINKRDQPPLLSLEKGDPHKPEMIELGPLRPEDMISTDSGQGDMPMGQAKYPPGWDITMKYFIQAVRSNNEKKHPTNFKDNLHSMAIPLCARESWNRNGAPVNVQEYLGLYPHDS